MKNFKLSWEINRNWQLIFPFIGILIAGYSALKITQALFDDLNLILFLLISFFIVFVILKVSVFVINKLENRWVVKQKWELIRIFIVFAVTGTSSMFVSRPFIALLGITKENLNPLLYWFLFIIIGIIFYQILLVFFGWLFGQFKFFWDFEKKMLKHFGLKRFLNE
ncbi:DUF6787 family protein [Paucihalobacter sp.]|uniref:DUF6787 family protein n=1 Tax=Paucihalobacter sp. TaxID=2850405 RepID=UPI002FE2CDA4